MVCRDNILLSKPEKGLPYVAKLVDFGISETIGKAGTKDALNCGAAGLTWAYASPEVMRQQTPTPKADVYSFGVIMWQLFSGKVMHSSAGTSQAPQACTAYCLAHCCSIFACTSISGISHQ